MYDNLCIGEIVNTHGVKGELKVVPLLDDVNDLFDYSHVFIEGKEYEVESIRFHKECALMKLKGIDEMDLAERYKGKFLELPRAELKPLPDNRYYICDLIGVKVIDENLGELGIIEEVLETGSNNVYVLTYKGKPLCIPVLEDVIHETDLTNGIIKVTIPNGLL